MENLGIKKVFGYLKLLELLADFSCRVQVTLHKKKTS